MAVTWEVRQQVKTSKKSWLESVYSSEYARPAEHAYFGLCRENPDDYFELVRVTHDEECLHHNGKPPHGR